MRVRIALCDDERDARARYGALADAVARSRGLDVELREYETGAQLLFDMADGHYLPDIVLLDIVMPGADGVDVARELRRKGYGGAIVFVTVTDARVFDAFDVRAFNYVLKDAGAGGDPDGRFRRVFLSALDAVEARRKKYVLLNGISEHRSIAIDDISFFESNRHVCTVHYGRGDSFEFVSTLSRVENYLLAHGFCRIHRSYLVNCREVGRYTSRACVLRDGTELPLGRQHLAAFRQTMEAIAAVSAAKGEGDGTDAR